LNGYIDEEVWFGDEITPAGLHEALYGADNQLTDDVFIRLNSCGGSCNAATRMFDDVRAYPGSVSITISGTAASAATVLAMAADRLEMTPGSLFMIHDPSVFAWGNERDLMEAIGLLKACKESILNIYGTRCPMKRDDLAAMMSATMWMDAQAALASGFIDGLAEGDTGLVNASKPRTVNRTEAEAKVQAWLNRHKPQPSRPVKGDDHTSIVLPDDEQATRPGDPGGTAQTGSPAPTPPPEASGTPIAQLHKRLGLLMPARQSIKEAK
jgi:ATP-dependent Clp protease protease subunit